MREKYFGIFLPRLLTNDYIGYILNIGGRDVPQKEKNDMVKGLSKKRAGIWLAGCGGGRVVS